MEKLSCAEAKHGTASVEDLSSDTLWLFISIVFIFVLFSASRSRRSYYILPIVPWCILFTAAWFSEPHESWSFLRKITDGFLKLVDVLSPFAAGILILASATAIAYTMLHPVDVSRMFHPVIVWNDLKSIILTLMPFMFFAGVAWLIIWFRSRKQLLREGKEGVLASSADPLNRVVPLTSLVIFTVFSFVIPTLSETESFEPTRWFLLWTRYEMKAIEDKDPEFLKRTAYFGSVGNAELTFYLKLPEPIRTFSLEKLDDTNRTFTDDTVDVQGLDEFRVFLADVLEHGGMVITRGDWIYSLEELKEGEDILKMLRNDEMVFRSSDLNGFQELKLEKLRAKPGYPDDPKLMRKIKKLDGKRLNIFYHIPESIAPPPAAAGAEGTSQP